MRHVKRIIYMGEEVLLFDLCERLGLPYRRIQHRIFSQGWSVERALLAPTRSAEENTKHPLYQTWCAMKQRCYNEKCPKYHLYGGRGVRVCSQWMGSFAKFLRDVGDRPDGTTLDRVDPNGHYEPSNVRWASTKEQNRNRRGVKVYNYNGKKLTLPEITEMSGANYDKVRQRINRLGWSLEEALHD